MSYVIVSFYTKDTPYEAEAQELIKSLGDRPHAVYERPNLGEWTRNTQQKAEVLQDALLDFPDDNIVWLDADARLVGDPVLFNELEGGDCDVAHGWLDYKGVSEVLSGTLWLRNTVPVLEMVGMWVHFNRQGVRPDQHTLARAIAKSHKVESTRLPPEYCAIFDHRLHKNLDHIVLHTQASRNVRRRKWDLAKGAESA